jgi:hypothetical protein
MHILPENLRSDAHAPSSALRFGTQFSNKLHYSGKIFVDSINAYVKVS